MRSSLPLALLLLVASTTAGAQLRQPTEHEIEQAKRQYRQPTEAEIEAARRKYRAPPAGIDRAQASQSPVNADALPRPQGHVDIEALVRSFEAHRGVFQAPSMLIDEATLFVFVTLGMPETTLKLLIDQAARSRAKLVLRGLKDASIRRTAERVQQLIGQANVEFQIDPQAFDRFAVRVAPTFVLVKDGSRASDCAAGACLEAHAFASIAGDVSIDYALKAIVQRAPHFKNDAQTFLRRLGG